MPGRWVAPATCVLVMGTVRMTGCPLSLKAVPLIPLLVHLRPLMAISVTREFTKAVTGPGVGCQTAVVQVGGSGARG